MSGTTVFGSALLGALQRHDTRGLQYVLGRRHRRLDPAMRLLTRAGDAPVMIMITIALLATGAGALRVAGVVAAVALSVSHALVQLLKRTISRQRPALPPGVALLVRPPDRFSFPSGHAAAAFAVALAVAPAVGGAALPVLAVGFGVGVTRCYLGVHYPGDVVAGWLLAVAGWLVGLGFQPSALGG